MYAVFSKDAVFAVDKIDEDSQINYDLHEDTPESREEAIKSGFKFAHLFEQHIDDYDQTYYSFVTSQIL
jgi:hypothetical protein